MITFDESAHKEVLRLMGDDHLNRYLRMSVSGGGCSGFSIKLEFIKEVNPNDKVFIQNAFHVIVDPRSFLFLVGTEVSFEGGLNGNGFNYKIPRADRTCGCGTSFAIKE